MKLSRLFIDFFKSEKSGGLILVFVTFLSLTLANSTIHEQYLELFDFKILGLDFIHFVNDGLMTVFFLLIGLELKREIYIGELSNIKSGSLTIVGAIGGMLIPAGIFYLLNRGTGYESGAGIPMATDIAFAIGILSLLGNRVPASLKIFLTALAVIDDLGAIIVIALFYSTSISIINLFGSIGIFLLLLLFNRLRIYMLLPYLLAGSLMWYFMMHSGVHPAISGVMLAFVIPFIEGDNKSPSYRLQSWLHKPVAFIILPLFALVNTAIYVGENWAIGLGKTTSMGILIGLVIGKPLGIWLFSFLGVRAGLCKLPKDLKWTNIIGVGFLGGIGFTMSIFITLLAYDNIELIINSKIAILLASLIAGCTGYIWLKFSLKNNSISKIKKLQP